MNKSPQNGDTDQNDEEHEVGKEVRRKSKSEDEDHSEVNLDLEFFYPRLRRDEINSVLKSETHSNSSPRF
jgi:hypothetical protein